MDSLSRRIRFVVLAGALAAVTPVFAQADHKHSGAPSGAAAKAKPGKLAAVTAKDAEWVAKARKEYPLEVCVTSDEKLGSMGKSPEYIYRVDGAPDRLVILCCDGCEEDFTKEPAKYLAKIDAAKAARAAKRAK